VTPAFFFLYFAALLIFVMSDGAPTARP